MKIEIKPHSKTLQVGGDYNLEKHHHPFFYIIGIKVTSTIKNKIKQNSQVSHNKLNIMNTVLR